MEAAGFLDDVKSGEERTIADGLHLSQKLTFDKTRQGVAIRVSSSNSDDTITLGDGCRTVVLFMIDSLGDEVIKSVSMNGTGAAFGLDGETYIACNRVVCVAHGDDGINNGTIFVGPASAT